jgi:hypothetical protein
MKISRYLFGLLLVTVMYFMIAVLTSPVNQLST